MASTCCTFCAVFEIHQSWTIIKKDARDSLPSSSMNGHRAKGLLHRWSSTFHLGPVRGFLAKTAKVQMACELCANPDSKRSSHVPVTQNHYWEPSADDFPKESVLRHCEQLVGSARTTHDLSLPCHQVPRNRLWHFRRFCFAGKVAHWQSFNM